MQELGGLVPFSFPSAAASGTVTVTGPDGVPLAPVTLAQSAGALVGSFTTTLPGRHTVRAVDGIGGVWSDVFNVRSSQPLALCSLADVRAHLNMDDPTVTADDAELRGHIEAATVAIERHRNEIVARRTLTAQVQAGRFVPHTPVLSVVSAAQYDGTAVDVSAWAPNGDTGQLLVPLSAVGYREDAGYGWPLDGGWQPPNRYRLVTVTYVAGYAVVPEAFILAAEIIAAHLWETQNMSSVNGGGIGAQEYIAPSGQGYAIPNRAVELLGGRPPVFA